MMIDCFRMRASQALCHVASFGFSSSWSGAKHQSCSSKNRSFVLTACNVKNIDGNL